MRFPKIKKPLTGIAIPLSAIRTQETTAIGEFPDLAVLGGLCQKLGIEVIQILPVNDTGLESSPYSALSAFALHPVYLRIQDIPGHEQIKTELATFNARYSKTQRLDFKNILLDKLKILRNLYEALGKEIQENPELSGFIEKNPWIVPYSVFMDLKLKNQWSGWQSWTSFRNPSLEEIQKYWIDPSTRQGAYFFAWLQFHCENQLKNASMKLEEMNVSLKGDIPILINEDSADTWAYPDTFALELRAGSPPDEGSPEGQNWGFPIYKWEVLAKDGYRWWKERILQADKFYHAYRIDHVLGFFRIWATPQENFSSNLGYFLPSKFFSPKDLEAKGFGGDRLLWLCEPHMSGSLLRDNLGLEWAEAVKFALEKLGNEDLYRFQKKIVGEKALSELNLSPHAKFFLMGEYRNRALLKINDEAYTPSWTYYKSRAYASLNDHEKWIFDSLAQELWRNSEDLWKVQGDALMDFMKNTAPMLVCAEDLGAIPDCVPEVLEKHKILGLRIPRWSRNWNHPGQPYYPVEDYPFLSVCAPSVHDTSTMRQWWREEPDHHGFLESLGINEVLGEDYDIETAVKVIRGLMQSRSALTILPLQDFLALSDDLRTDNPEDERINLPGTVTDKNWTYRIKVSVEELANHKIWCELILSMTKVRGDMALLDGVKEVSP